MANKAPFHNRTQLERSVEKLIAQADTQNRGGDLDRVVGHLEKTPDDVSRLTSLMMLLDDDFRTPLKQNVDAFRRFEEQKGREVSDNEIVDILKSTYDRVRKG